MWIKLKQLIILLLVLSVQMQPVHVHAVELKTVQSGHLVGTLQHSHTADAAHLSESDRLQDDTGHSVDSGHCHPGHLLSPVTAGLQSISKITQFAMFEPVCRLSSVTLTQDTPPPRVL